MDRKFMMQMAKVEKLRTPVVPHLLMSIITCGIWLPIWMILAMITAGQRKVAEKELEKMV